MLQALCTLLTAVTVAASFEDFLLPGDVTPYHYDLRVIYDIDKATHFAMYGCVDILLAANKEARKIVLHAQNMTISSDVTLSGVSNTPGILSKSFDIGNSFNFLEIELDGSLGVGQNYTLTIPFSGNLIKGLLGVYISSYVDTAELNTESLVTTQFEPLYARKGFPCFDEPAYKATFSINIGHGKEYNAISNMPLLGSADENLLEKWWPWTEIEKTFQKPQSRFVWDTFETSVPMSTYLVAFVVSKLSFKESPHSLSKTEFNIWARHEVIDQASYAASLAPKMLSHYEKFFDLPVPLPKQDMIAIPDFKGGAMENWGLITYKEMLLLYNEAYTSLELKQNIAEVIAHKLANQWFGNLVTMRWWSDVWLKEGFAAYMARTAVEIVEPSFKANHVRSILHVLKTDALESSHPLSVKLNDPKRILEIFDPISYQKGSVIIRMMVMFMGMDVFKKAIHNYLLKYSYSNADKDDLWSELAAASQDYGQPSNISLKAVMDSWTTQAGYPLLNVTRNYTDKTLSITQKRYLSIGVKSYARESWWVPLNVMCQCEVGKPPQTVMWLADNEGVNSEHKLEHGAISKEWVLFNFDMIALYRVNYDTENWQLLIKTLNSDSYKDIPELGRVQLLSDAFELAWSDQLDYSTTFNLSNYLKREMRYIPLQTGLQALEKIGNIMKRTADYEDFQNFMRQVVGIHYELAGGLYLKDIINPKDLTSVLIQKLMSYYACEALVPGCEENAVELFHRWMEEKAPDYNNPIPVDLRSIVYCVAIRRGSEREWQFLLERKRRATFSAPGAVKEVLTALTCTRLVGLLTQYLEWTLIANGEIRREYALFVIQRMTASTEGYAVAKEFIYARIKDIYEMHKDQGLGSMYFTLLSQFTTQKELDEFLLWSESREQYLIEFKQSVSQGVETARNQISWVQRNKHMPARLRQYVELYKSRINSESYKSLMIQRSSMQLIEGGRACYGKNISRTTIAFLAAWTSVYGFLIQATIEQGQI